MIVSGISLVLEGGGMRGMFSAGVFEAFMQKELIFPHIVGVSAGACNIVSYMSQQPLRTRRVIQNYVGDKRYCSLSNWLRTRSLFGFDFILKELPQNLLPFDYEAFRKYPGQLSYLPVMPVTVKNTRYRNICCASSINTILNYGKPWPDVLTYIMTSLLLPNNWNRTARPLSSVQPYL